MKSNLVALSVAVALLAGCDLTEKASLAKERGDRDYRAAMSDYQAGRLSQALAGLKKVCAEDPSNTSARFQLACLLQDSEKDYAGAYCAYAEYLVQSPVSDKAKLAKDRMASAEAELAKELAKKYGLDVAGQSAEALKTVRKQLAESQQELQRTQKDLVAKINRIAFLEEESARLKSLMRAEVESSGEPSELAEDKPSEDDEAIAPDRSGIEEAKELLAAADDEEEAKTESVDDAKALLAEMNDDPPVLQQSADAKDKRAAAKKAADQAKSEREQLLASSRSKLEPIPEDGVYVVQEGDTLYKIANRFYGKTAAWKEIREKNKATVSTDGRVKAGQKLILPPLK